MYVIRFYCSGSQISNNYLFLAGKLLNVREYFAGSKRQCKEYVQQAQLTNVQYIHKWQS